MGTQRRERRNKTYRWHTKERHQCQRRSIGKGGEATWPPPPTANTPPPPHTRNDVCFIDFVKPFSMLLPMCLQDSKSRTIQGGGGVGWGLHVELQGENIQVAGTEGHWPSDQFAPFCPTDGDVTVGLFVFTCCDKSDWVIPRVMEQRQNWAATVLKYLLKHSAEPPIMSLHCSKPLCKTHLGPLNDFYTLGSFPDSHFIQLKSRSAPTPLKHG